MQIRALIVVFLTLLGASCAGPAPYEEYTYARTALDAARSSGAAKYAPGLWFKADEAYRKGAKAYKDRYFKEARDYLINARKYAEKAENSTRLKKFESGDGF